ncbi:hypothetical protein QTP88_014109 [Uroleucon formosanum]
MFCTVHNITTEPYNVLYNDTISSTTSFTRPEFFRFIIIIIKTTVIVCVSFFLCTGCVKFKYVPDIESIAVNVTYGKGNVQNGVIKGNNPEPVCMDVLVGFGQLCARFVGNSSTPKDFDGCLKLEATLLNEVQNSIPMGCFKMDQNRLIFNSTVVDLPEEQSSNSTESGEEEEGEEEGEEGVDPSEEAFIQAFGQTAVQGVTWLVHVMGLNLNQSTNAGTATASNAPTGQQQPAPANV